MESLTEEQLKELKQVFNLFDKDSNGYISSDELEQVLQGINQNPTKEEVQQHMDEMDPDGSGQITWEAFVNVVIEKLRSPEEQSAIITAAFKVFDKDNSGKLSLQEVKDILMRGEDGVTEEDIQDFFNTADVDGDDQINYQEMKICQKDTRSKEEKIKRKRKFPEFAIALNQRFIAA